MCPAGGCKLNSDCRRVTIQEYLTLVPGYGFNKGRSLKFHEGSRVRQTPEERWRTCRPKRCGNNNKDEDNSPKTLNGKNM